jgi:hypothetical protein
MIDEIRFTSWGQFKSQFIEYLPTGSVAEDFVFRGQKDISFKLVPSFTRNFGGGGRSTADIWNLQQEGLRNFKSEAALFHKTVKLPDIDKKLQNFARKYPGRIPGFRKNRGAAESRLLTDCIEIWAYGQHHNLPTPLLDWTSSPYIAAFFAYESAFHQRIALSKAEINVSKDYVAVYALRKRGPGIQRYWHEMRIMLVTTMETAENTRIKNQRGLFTLLPPDISALDDCLIAYCARTGRPINSLLIKFGLPYHSVVDAICDLELMDINARKIYDDWPGVCSSANMKMLMSAQTP